MKVELRPLVGTIVGGPVTDGQPATITHDMDEIWLEDFKGEMKKVGHIGHKDGAGCNFFRILDEHREPVRKEVAKLRKDRGLTTSDQTSQPPNPAEIRKLLKKGGKS